MRYPFSYVTELRRRMKAAPVTANEAGDESDLEETVTAPKRPRTSGTCKAGAAAVATPSDETIKLESPEAPPSSADVTESAGSRDSKRTRASRKESVQLRFPVCCLHCPHVTLFYLYILLFSS
jgi:TPP-dependent indolepyruvate ferredoxin oxidoreductase alpha subunit